MQTLIIAIVNFLVTMISFGAENGWYKITEWTSTVHLFFYIQAHGMRE